jgi:lipopolysaccharide/colanic/teichoic acid biosynthesis glycosyltransferase
VPASLAWRLRVKRIVDIVICCVALPLVLPIGLLCALAIAIDSPGPVVFTQQRTGRHGRRSTSCRRSST